MTIWETIPRKVLVYFAYLTGVFALTAAMDKRLLFLIGYLTIILAFLIVSWLLSLPDRGSYAYEPDAVLGFSVLLCICITLCCFMIIFLFSGDTWSLDSYSSSKAGWYVLMRGGQRVGEPYYIPPKDAKETEMFHAVSIEIVVFLAAIIGSIFSGWKIAELCPKMWRYVCILPLIFAAWSVELYIY